MATCSSATATDPDAPTVTVRDAGAADASAIARIYASEVRSGTASYETEPPSDAEMAARMASAASGGHPWLVAEVDGTIAGYACASPFRARPAYRWTVENSVYVDAAWQGRGIGRHLLDALIARCTALGYRRMIAVIGDAENAASIALHARAGFQPVGRFPGIGWKHGRWLTGVQMQRALGDGDATPPFAAPGPTA